MKRFDYEKKIVGNIVFEFGCKLRHKKFEYSSLSFNPIDLEIRLVGDFKGFEFFTELVFFKVYLNIYNTKPDVK